MTTKSRVSALERANGKGVPFLVAVGADQTTEEALLEAGGPFPSEKQSRVLYVMTGIPKTTYEQD